MRQDDLAFAKAAAYYRKGNNCAQSVILAVSEAEGEEIPGELITGTTGFGGGIGFSGDACGAINGGIIALGVFLSRKGVKENAIPKASGQFLRWFKDEFGESNCHDLRAGKSFRRARDLCGDITARTARKVVETIEGY